MTNKNLNDAFGIEDDEIFEDVKTHYEELIDSDYQIARKTIIDNIQKTSSAIDEVLELAKASQSARAYEVAAAMIKTSFDGSKDLLALAAKNKELKQIEYETNSKTGNVTNNLFVGSTEELRQLIANEGMIESLKDKQYTNPSETKTISLDKDGYKESDN